MTMADTDEEVVVHIDDEQLAGALGLEAEAAKGKQSEKLEVKVIDKSDDDPVDSLKSQFATLQQTAAASERERAEALRQMAAANDRAEQAARERDEAKGHAVESQYDTVVSGLSAAEAEALAAEGDYKAAFEAGDATAAAKAQRLIARAEAKLSRLQEAKADIEDAQEAKKTKAAEPKPQPRTDDPVETYLNGRSAPTQAWLREHRDFITDPKKNAKLTAAHYDATGDGLQPDTKEYFDHVEGFLGLKAAKQASQPSQRRPSSPTLPVQHAGGGTNGGGNEVRLTRAEVAAANDGTIVYNYDDPKGKFKKGDVVGTQEFARRKLAMTKSGHYDKSYTEG